MTRARSLVATAALLLATAVGALAYAQVPEPPADQLWTVQTVALRDFREAQGTADALEAHGFDAYTEFAMDAGRQFVRVRVGCFASRAAAEAMADALRGRVTDAAVPVELSPGAPVAGCVRMVVGFLKPFAWDEVGEPGTVPAFRVEVAGIDAHVVHTGARWRVLQEGEGVPAIDPAAPAVRFAQYDLGGMTFVRLVGAGGPTILCPGRLITSVGEVAISEQGEALVACSLVAIGAR